VGDWEVVRTGSREEPSAYFFVSYAHNDAEYVARLADHLRGSGLPVWFDAELQWGSRFSQEIRRRIRGALGVIVVMSPAAEASEWVEREILEGQRYDRQLLPILLRGERLFLLASSLYFDARDGALPGDRELRQLSRIHDASLAGPGPTQDTPLLSWAPVVAAADRRPVASVPAETNAGMAVRRLWSHLDEDRVEHADILTTSLLLEAVGRLDSGWMRRADGEHLPFDLLAGIDASWSKFSAGTHGFARSSHAIQATPLALRLDDSGTSPRSPCRSDGRAPEAAQRCGTARSSSRPTSTPLSSRHCGTRRSNGIRAGMTSGLRR